jgi:nucleoid DNA-binding protein
MTEAIDVIFDTIAEALTNGDETVIRSFGRFYTQTIPSYSIKRVRTGEPHLVESRPLPVFKSSKALRRRLRGEP